jgi:hypothetical protein
MITSCGFGIHQFARGIMLAVLCTLKKHLATRSPRRCERWIA